MSKQQDEIDQLKADMAALGRLLLPAAGAKPHLMDIIMRNEARAQETRPFSLPEQRTAV
jgi:hypothetical protein